MILSAVAVAGTDEADVRKLMDALPEMTCFRYEYPEAATHRWQKPHVAKGAPWVLLRKDGDGFLVAQPEGTCESSYTGTGLCPFWLRTVEYKDSWVSTKYLKVIACPKKLSEAYFRKLIKAKFSDKLEF
jgi:hypothetical protein